MELSTAIQEIKATGNFSDSAIAERVQATQPTITRIRQGKSKGSFDVGIRIIALHEETCLQPEN